MQKNVETHDKRAASLRIDRILGAEKYLSSNSQHSLFDFITSVQNFA